MKARLATALAAPALLLALALYGDHFFQATPRPRWEQLLASLEQRLGPPEAHELVGWNVFVGTQEGATGTFVSLSYAVRYAKAEGSEEITLLREKGAPDFRIVQHQFHSAALLLPEFGGEPPQDAPPDSTSL